MSEPQTAAGVEGAWHGKSSDPGFRRTGFESLQSVSPWTNLSS